MRLLQRIRDEAHRFAVEYHRLLRKKRTVTSVVEEIPGIGAKRRSVLLKRFGSLKRLKAASVEEIENVDGISASLARQIYGHLHPDSQSRQTTGNEK